MAAHVAKDLHLGFDEDLAEDLRDPARHYRCRGVECLGPTLVSAMGCLW